MGNACTASTAPPSGSTGEAQPVWGPSSARSSELLSPVGVFDPAAITLEEVGDTPCTYPARRTDYSDCLGCFQAAPPPPELIANPEPDEAPFKCAVAVVRHGERQDQINPRGWFKSELGQAYPFDCPITEQGRESARSVANALRNSGQEFALVVSSPYVRCVQTAAEICEELGLQLAIDAELSEIYGPRTHGQWKKPPPRRNLSQISALAKLHGVPLQDSKLLVRNEGCDFFGSHSIWPEHLEDARIRLVSRVEQYLARSIQLRRNFILVTHGDCVAAALGLLLSSQPGENRQVVTKINYCAYAVAERMVDPEDLVPLGLADEAAGWRLSHGNCRVSDFDGSQGKPVKGPYDPCPPAEEARRVKKYEEDQKSSEEFKKRKLKKKSSTTVLKSALHRQRSKEVLGVIPAMDLQYCELLPENKDGLGASPDTPISSGQDIAQSFWNV